MAVPILAYHKVSNQFEWGITTVSIRSFHKQVKYLAEHRYYSISLEQYLFGNPNRESNGSPLIITFDDADESIFRYAFPILSDYGFAASVFVISDYVGKQNSWDANLGGRYSKHLNWEQIMTLVNQGWEIGSHTATHRDLLGLSEAEIKLELQSSRATIESNIARPVRFISYPFNRFDARIIALAQQLGYVGGCALSPQKNLSHALKRFQLRRCGVYSIDSLGGFKKKLQESAVEQFKQRIICMAATGTIWYKRLRNQK